KNDRVLTTKRGRGPVAQSPPCWSRCQFELHSPDEQIVGTRLVRVDGRFELAGRLVDSTQVGDGLHAHPSVMEHDAGRTVIIGRVERLHETHYKAIGGLGSTPCHTIRHNRSPRRHRESGPMVSDTDVRVESLGLDNTVVAERADLGTAQSIAITGLVGPAE